MKLSNIVSEMEITKLNELGAPMLGATPPAGTAPVAPVAGAQPAAPGQAAAPTPQDLALAVKQKADQRKQIQDQIRATEQQLIDLRKQLAQIV